MSLLIKGMEMPTSCHECRMYEADIYYCATADRVIDIPDSSERRCSFCPLIPVQPHGRLIDADALTISTAVPLDGKPYKYVHIDNIKNAPTIIPAEEGE